MIAAGTAFVIWGVLPVFWKALDAVDPLEVLCHRIVWSVAGLLPFMFFQGRLGSLLLFLRSLRNVLCLVCTALLLAGNWFLYIWAISSNMVVEASLGYFINPLINVVFGVLVFKEQGSKLSMLAVAIAAAGVAVQIAAVGSLPFVPLGLGFSFALYGLIRKLLIIEAIPGLFAETLVVFFPAAGYLIYLAAGGGGAMLRMDAGTDLLLMGAGLITTFPLLMFTYAAKRVRLTTLGILQYLSPCCVFLLGVFVYGEPFPVSSFVTFACIWTAVALYIWDTTRRKQW